jgi:hypothetical protein
VFPVAHLVAEELVPEAGFFGVVAVDGVRARETGEQPHHARLRHDHLVAVPREGPGLVVAQHVAAVFLVETPRQPEAQDGLLEVPPELRDVLRGEVGRISTHIRENGSRTRH